MPLGIKPIVDFVFKKVFGSPENVPVLIGLLNAILRLPTSRCDLNEQSISAATAIEQWAFFFLFADRHEAERLRELLPGIEFQQAISVVEAIAAKTEDRMMYDQRLKAQRDYQWGLDSARQEGVEVGSMAGKIQLLQQLLGEESSSTEGLLELPTDELSRLLADLQQRLRSRDA